MHRFRVSARDLAAPKLQLRGKELRHLRDVLRLSAGSRVELFDGEGRAVVAVVDAIDRASAELTIVAPSKRRTESSLVITLAIALPKGAKLDWVVEKATELGVSRVLPFTSERTIPERASYAAKHERWRRIAAAAAAQSGRTRCPEIEEVASFATVLERKSAHDRAILFWEQADEALRLEPHPGISRLLVVTGPEGGFSEREAEAAREAGFEIACLGPRTLRAETAAVVAVALAQIAWGDLLMARGAC